LPTRQDFSFDRKRQQSLVDDDNAIGDTVGDQALEGLCCEWHGLIRQLWSGLSSSNAKKYDFTGKYRTPLG
jgi:hypothetical protein